MADKSSSSKKMPEIKISLPESKGLSATVQKVLDATGANAQWQNTLAPAAKSIASAVKPVSIPDPSSLYKSNASAAISETARQHQGWQEQMDRQAREMERLMRPKWHELIIIGNGFDLECGLPSGFGSFIKARNEAFKAGCKQENNPLSFTKTIWDVILATLDDSSWCDVENAIACWVLPQYTDETRNTRSKTVLDHTVDELNAREHGHGSGKVGNDGDAKDVIATYLLKRFIDKIHKWDRNRLLSISRNDLGIFERDFAHYLANAVDVSPDYEDRADSLIHQLLLHDAPDDLNEMDASASVLSFNYTRPTHNVCLGDNEVSYVNIHGRLGKGNIIFGIDGTDHLTEPDALPFTKTYRLMALDVPDTDKLIQPPSGGLNRDYGNALIKVYGHSLSAADYSYFQAIFDAVQLYQSSTRLIFYVRPYSVNGREKPVDEVRAETMRSVIQLLSDYGATLDNKDHGKNLIHKLLLEGRLSVKELPR